MPIQINAVDWFHLNRRRYLTGLGGSHNFLSEKVTFASEVLVLFGVFSPLDEATISEDAFQGVFPIQDDVGVFDGAWNRREMGEMITGGCPIPGCLLLEGDVVASGEKLESGKMESIEGGFAERALSVEELFGAQNTQEKSVEGGLEKRDCDSKSVGEVSLQTVFLFMAVG